MTTLVIRRKDLLSRRAAIHHLETFKAFARRQERRDTLHVPLSGLLWAFSDQETLSFWQWLADEGLIPGVVSPEADLAGLDFGGAFLRGAILHGACFRGANLSYADLEGADLEGADFTDADLRGADLTCANLRGARLQGARLVGSISPALFRGARRWAEDPPIPGWTLCGSTLADATSEPKRQTHALPTAAREKRAIESPRWGQEEPVGYSKKVTALVNAARAYADACESRRKAYETWRADRIRTGVGDARLATAADAARSVEYETEEALREAVRNLGGKP